MTNAWMYLLKLNQIRISRFVGFSVAGWFKWVVRVPFGSEVFCIFSVRRVLLNMICHTICNIF